MSRTILHSDCNAFYASVECLINPRLQSYCVAVCGDVQARHGIILAKNQNAKEFGVKTGEPIWMAKKKCPQLVTVQADFARYLEFAKRVREIYLEYTDRVEPFGLDEAWLDVTGSARLFGSGKAIAEEIRRRVREEIGITVSIGVSFNKIFAKLGSDYQKPDAVTVISRDNFREIVWPLPSGELLYVGPATKRSSPQWGFTQLEMLRAAGRSCCAAISENGATGFTPLQTGWTPPPSPATAKYRRPNRLATP